MSATDLRQGRSKRSSSWCMNGGCGIHQEVWPQAFGLREAGGYGSDDMEIPNEVFIDIIN